MIDVSHNYLKSTSIHERDQQNYSKTNDGKTNSYDIFKITQLNTTYVSCLIKLV